MIHQKIFDLRFFNTIAVKPLAEYSRSKIIFDFGIVLQIESVFSGFNFGLFGDENHSVVDIVQQTGRVVIVDKADEFIRRTDIQTV